MHASIWRFSRNPDELLDRYDAMLGEVPAESMRLHLCLRAPDGVVVVDTCPSLEAFEGFVPRFAALCERHGLPEPERVEGFPVHRAFGALG